MVKPFCVLSINHQHLLWLSLIDFYFTKGGRTAYFGELGENCQTMINYFEKYGANPCPKANPAEWMLQVVGAAPGSHANKIILKFGEILVSIKPLEEINRMEAELSKLPRDNDPEALLKYAPLWKQYLLVSWRTIVQDWRSPGYIYSKLILVISSSLFIGFHFSNRKITFKVYKSQMLAVFMFSFHSRHLLIKCYLILLNIELSMK